MILKWHDELYWKWKCWKRTKSAVFCVLPTTRNIYIQNSINITRTYLKMGISIILLLDSNLFVCTIVCVDWNGDPCTQWSLFNRGITFETSCNIYCCCCKFEWYQNSNDERPLQKRRSLSMKLIEMHNYAFHLYRW